MAIKKPELSKMKKLALWLFENYINDIVKSRQKESSEIAFIAGYQYNKGSALTADELRQAKELFEMWHN